MRNGKYTLADLHLNDHAIIDSFDDNEISLKLLELGCLPGMEVIVNSVAPFGCPMAVSVNGSTFGLRREEARAVIVRPFAR